jgi:LacI family gluconate utilization system Gnt-I transcriptional repressor
VRTPRWAIGEAGAQMLLQLMRGGQPPQHSVRLPYEVVARAST